jgi:L-amino acid N-acyltransferase YncA
LPDLVIRPFAWGDVPAVTAIYAHYVATSTATFDTEPPGETATALKFGQMVELGHPVLIAERDGKVAAYAYASVFRPRPGYVHTCEDTVYCAPDALGMGIGSAMLARVIDEARARDFRQMVAVIADDGGGSIPLHEKHGFQVVGRYPGLGFKFGRWLDVAHMQRAL